ncbi:hypothetical protein [Erwinia psidii]|uniref:hypothetical protein n=1 Tax=Erwinia psidii TaxID=69224 RepID=UPI00226B9F0E|nr:hypothetical protein [Erwinia psidii]
MFFSTNKPVTGLLLGMILSGAAHAETEVAGVRFIVEQPAFSGLVDSHSHAEQITNKAVWS